MIDKLKSFVNKHRQEFDTKEPGKELWEKIDAKMEVKKTSWISSKWLSRLKYIALSTSVFLLTLYVISQNSNNSKEVLAKSNTNSTEVSLAEPKTIDQNENQSNSDFKQNPDLSTPNPIDNTKFNTKEKTITHNEEKRLQIKADSITYKNDSAVVSSKTAVTQITESAKMKSESPLQTMNEEEKLKTIKIKKTAMVPEEIEKTDSYRGILYEGSSFCSLVKAYKFPGQISIDGNMKTMGCSKLESITNLKAVCLKGKTGKKITLSLKDGFKNIVLEKSDGRKLNPEAISHYYKGLGVISGYTGKSFDMYFKDRVELILFFKDAEAGDKILIDGIIEALVESKQ